MTETFKATLGETTYTCEMIEGGGPFKAPINTTRGLSNIIHTLTQPSGTQIRVPDGNIVLHFDDGYFGHMDAITFRRLFDYG